MKRSVLQIISEVLQSTLWPELQGKGEGDRKEQELNPPPPATLKLLQTVARASTDIVEVYYYMCVCLCVKYFIEYLSDVLCRTTLQSAAVMALLCSIACSTGVWTTADPRVSDT